MAILTDSAILGAIETGEIVITPFKRKNLGTNSYDLTLGNKLKVYDIDKDGCLDTRSANGTIEIDIPEDGFILQPNILYLASCNEYTETHTYVPMLADKSSIARLGVGTCFNAGFGDVGFCGYWTIEIVVTHPTKIYAGDKIAQLFFSATSGLPLVKYGDKKGAKYQNQPNEPISSKNHLNK